ncbi:hypothetical protein [Leclercia adecarboxylata]
MSPPSGSSSVRCSPCVSNAQRRTVFFYPNALRCWGFSFL